MADELQIDVNAGAGANNAFPKGIVKFKDILSTRFQKPFESISESEIKSDLITSGRTKSEIRDVLQGFRKFKRRDADFVLEDGGFRINTTEGALKGSGRRKGATVGQSDLARILRLGEDVSKFAGYAEAIGKEVNTPDIIEPSDTTLADEDVSLGDVNLNIDPNIAGPPSSSGGTGGRGGGDVTPEQIDQSFEDFGISDELDLNLPFSGDPNQGLEDEPSFWDDPVGNLGEMIGADKVGKVLGSGMYDLLYPNAEKSYEEFRAQEEANKKRAKELGIDYVHELQPFRAPVGIAGPGSYLRQLRRIWRPKGGLKGLRELWKTGKSKVKDFLPQSKEAQREVLRQARKAEEVAAKAKAARQAAQTAKTQPPVKQFKPEQFATKQPAPTTTPSTAPVKETVRRTVFQNPQNTPVPSRGLRYNTTTNQWDIFKKGGKFQGTESRIQSEYDNLETPHANIDLDLGRMIWQDQKSDSPLMFDETYYMAQEGPGYTAKSFKTSDDTSELGKMKKGGKMMKGQTGLKLTPFNEQAYNAKRFADSGLYNNVNTDIPFLASGAEQGDIYATREGEQGDLYDIKREGEGYDDGTGLNMNDLLYYGSVLGLPAGTAIASMRNIKNLEDQITPDLVSPDLNVGVVRDIRRPDQAIGYKPTTADMGAENANRQFQHAQNRAQRFAFEAGQDESKIRQEEAIRENQNRQRLMDAEIANQEERIRAGTQAQKYFRELGRRDQSLIGGAETIANIGVANQYTQSMGRLELAKGMMRAGDVEGAKRMLGIRKKGGKMTKFSNRYGTR